MHSVQSRAVFLGGLKTCPRKILKVRYFEIESGSTFCKIHHSSAALQDKPTNTFVLFCVPFLSPSLCR